MIRINFYLLFGWLYLFTYLYVIVIRCTCCWQHLEVDRVCGCAGGASRWHQQQAGELGDAADEQVPRHADRERAVEEVQR